MKRLMAARAIAALIVFCTCGAARAQSPQVCANVGYLTAIFRYLDSTCATYRLTKEGERRHGVVERLVKSCPGGEGHVAIGEAAFRAQMTKAADHTSGCKLAGVALDISSYKSGGPDLVVHPK